MHSSLDRQIVISPSVWPGKKLKRQPGDFDLVIPEGCGLEGPFPIRPWDEPFTTGPASYYAFQERTGNPFQDAPLTSAHGGVIYFGKRCDAVDLMHLSRLLGVNGDQRDYAAFIAESANPIQERWLVQLRIVHRFGLRYLFDALGPNEYERFPKQPLSLIDTLAAFVRDQEQHWEKGSNGALSGAAGGDGDWASESLGFGLMVENDYYGIYRIWSRAWLVTK